MRRKVPFLKACYCIGMGADLFATVPLLFPAAARLMFGLPAPATGDAYLYVSRIGASLMLGWTALLAWGSRAPVERRGVLLLTVAPVLLGLLVASVVVVRSEYIQAAYMWPLWLFYAVMIPLYLMAYVIASRSEV